MSLINRMLQDLDQRPGGQAVEAALPSGVQAVLVKPEASPRLRPQVAVGAGLGLVVAGFFYFFDGPLPFVAQPEVAAPVPVQPAAPQLPAPVVVPPAAVAEPAALTSPESSVSVAASRDMLSPKEEAVSHPVVRQPEKKPLSPQVVPQVRDRGGKVVAEANLPGKPVEKSFARSDRQHVADFHYRQSLDAYALGRTTESLAQAREALRLDPDHLDARQLLLRQLVEQRDMDAARSVLREGLQRHPEQAAWVKLALRLELEKGDLSAARALVEQAPPVAVAQADFQALAGMLAQRLGRQGEAAEHFRNALGRNPADGRSWIGLGLALEAQGHEPEARESFRRALATEGLPAELQALAQKKTR